MDGHAESMELCARCACAIEGSDHEPHRGSVGGIEESWRKYIAQHGFAEAWDDSNHRTEQDRYDPIVARLVARQESQMAAQRDIVQEKESWTLLMRRSKNRLKPHTAAVEEIMETADKVMLEWAERKMLEDSHAQQRALCANEWPRLFSEKKVRIGDWADEDTKELTVASTVFDRRYYLGHPGGDYIFRYSDKGNTDDLVTLSSMTGIPDVGWDTLNSPSWNSILKSNPEDLPRQLKYCGQVPRPVQEYTARLQVLVPAIAKMIVSVVGFHRSGGNSKPLSGALRELADLGMTSSRPEFNKLRLLWIEEFPGKDGRAPNEIRDRLRSSAKVLEFAHLLGKMAAAGIHMVLDELASLRVVLEMSTGWGLVEMSEIERGRVERRALHELLHKKEFEHLLVLDVPGFEHDVHAFYRSPQFESDPSHPCRRYKLRDVTAQLWKSLYLRHLGWLEDESESETAGDSHQEETGPHDCGDEPNESGTEKTEDKDCNYTEDGVDKEKELSVKEARKFGTATDNHTVPRKRVAEPVSGGLYKSPKARGINHKAPTPERKSPLVHSCKHPALKRLQSVNTPRRSTRVPGEPKL